MQGDSDEIKLHNRLVDDYLMFAPGLAQTMESASVSTAPLSKCLVGQLLLMANSRETLVAASTLLEEVDTRSLNNRERKHLDALSQQIMGDSIGASNIWAELVAETPSDVVALRLLHFSLFNQGRITEMVHSVRTARENWNDGLPRKSLLDGMLSFALCEAGEFSSAEPLGREAVSRNANDLWSVHAVAHVLEMQGRWEAGIQWIRESERALQAGGSFAGHVWWHLALYFLETGRHDDALALFDEVVYPNPSVEGLVLSNAIALLCRLEFVGVDVGGRWEGLADGLVYRLGHHSHPFNDCHYSFALGRLNKSNELEALLEGMELWSESDQELHSGYVLQACGLSVARGMAALGSGDSQLACSQLAEAADSWWRLGGSVAQRDLFSQALLRAQINCGMNQSNDHATLRVSARPRSPQARIWQAFAIEATGGNGSSAQREALALGWRSETGLKSLT
jgi:tetratricopeptide (TPR) repeat protein